ncbi:MAG: DMT family transporter [Albidovulum sp.]|uniref:DMT family transporter n=1 Tax=Albidovulum sp. TaxID=1872424 RepID=UPI003C9BE4C0
MARLYTQNPVALGVLCALGAAVLFSLNDVTIKFLSGDYALHQVVLIRSLIAISLLMAVFVPLQGGYASLRTRRLGMHVIRGLCVVTANMCFFAALAAMPIAEAVAIFFVSPLLITVFSVFFLRETVGPCRWVAVAFGLVGVLVMLRPGSEAFRPIALLPLLSAAAYAMLHILTRKIGGTERATTMAVYIQAMFILVSGTMGLIFGDGAWAGSGHASVEFLMRAWVWPAPGDWWLLVLLGLSNGTAGVLISQAYRLGEAALVAPFEYISMPMAVFWGIVVFSEWPDAYAILGIGLIIGGGLYMLYRETRVLDLPEYPRARR